MAGGTPFKPKGSRPSRLQGDLSGRDHKGSPHRVRGAMDTGDQQRLDSANGEAGLPPGICKDPKGSILEGTSVQGATQTWTDDDGHKISSGNQGNRTGSSGPAGDRGIFDILPGSQEERKISSHHGSQVAEPLLGTPLIQDGDLVLNCGSIQEGRLPAVNRPDGGLPSHSHFPQTQAVPSFLLWVYPLPVQGSPVWAHGSATSFHQGPGSSSGPLAPSGSVPVLIFG